MSTSVLRSLSTSLPCSRQDIGSLLSPIEGSQHLLPHLEQALSRAGFDIFEPLCIGWYNEAVQDLEESQIPIEAPPGSRTLAVLVGNCKNLWSHLLGALQAKPALLRAQDPVDEYTEDAIAAAASSTSCRCRVFYAHEETAGKSGGGYVAMQRLAEVAGCAYNDQFSHLSLHPRYGSWFALRALIVFDGIEFSGVQKPKVPNPMSRQTESYVRIAVRSARTPSTADLMHLGSEAHATSDEKAAEAMRRRWRKWVAVRDAPCPGHPWRYPEAMITYHYTNERHVLMEAVRQSRARRSF